ncbi:MAG: sulfotransferase [Ilumatobacter sp.]|nr:sulfotransferase [Ilumatobacter sp.]
MMTNRIAAALPTAVRASGRRVVRAAAMVTADLRPFPDLVIIGAKRAGTTSVFRALEQHRSMCPLVPSARRLPLRENMKGVHYFDSHWTRSTRWYRSHFPTTFSKALRSRTTGGAFTVEASPYYLFHPLAAERAAAVLPDTTQFVAILRDPVERTVSHWAEQTRNGVETLALADALDAEAARLGDADARLADGTSASSHPHEQQSFAAQSFYAESLQRWFDAVGRDRVKVLFAEDYYREPANAINRIVEFIGAPVIDGGDGVHRNAAERSGALDDATEARLIELFRADVAAVSELLGVQPPWARWAHSSSPSAEPMTGR